MYKIRSLATILFICLYIVHKNWPFPHHHCQSKYKYNGCSFFFFIPTRHELGKSVAAGMHVPAHAHVRYAANVMGPSVCRKGITLRKLTGVSGISTEVTARS